MSVDHSTVVAIGFPVKLGFEQDANEIGERLPGNIQLHETGDRCYGGDAHYVIGIGSMIGAHGFGKVKSVATDAERAAIEQAIKDNDLEVVGDFDVYAGVYTW